MELTQRRHDTIDYLPFVTTNKERIERKDFYHRMELRKAIAECKGQTVKRVVA